jgi:hypothetical protein
MSHLRPLLFLILTTPVCACLWDRDTIAMEALGRLEVVETAIGWFDRFPPEYYQMRLDRVSREITAEASKLELYDDAAVACDRLGRHDDAVAWMTKKQAVLASLPESKTSNHRYRLHANLGVFHTHLWLKTPEREKHPGALDLAIQEVRAAIQINPNAHFGREHAHLALLEWWRVSLDKPSKRMEQFNSTFNLPQNAFAQWHDIRISMPKTDMVKALCGLIQMGSAQDSPEVHTLLALELLGKLRIDELHYSLGYLACLRLGELCLEDIATVHADAGFREWLAPESHLKPSSKPLSLPETIDLLGPAYCQVITMGGSKHDLKPVHAWFHAAREAAKKRHEAKTTFMKSRFASGRHPDTDPDFWQGWQEPTMPPLPESKMEQILGVSSSSWLNDQGTIFAISFFLPSSLVVAIYVILRRRHHRRLRQRTVELPLQDDAL